MTLSVIIVGGCAYVGCTKSGSSPAELTPRTNAHVPQSVSILDLQSKVQEKPGAVLEPLPACSDTHSTKPPELEKACGMRASLFDTDGRFHGRTPQKPL